MPEQCQYLKIVWFFVLIGTAWWAACDQHVSRCWVTLLQTDLRRKWKEDPIKMCGYAHIQYYTCVWVQSLGWSAQGFFMMGPKSLEGLWKLFLVKVDPVEWHFTSFKKYYNWHPTKWQKIWLAMFFLPILEVWNIFLIIVMSCFKPHIKLLVKEQVYGQTKSEVVSDFNWIHFCLLKYICPFIFFAMLNWGIDGRFLKKIPISIAEWWGWMKHAKFHLCKNIVRNVKKSIRSLAKGLKGSLFSLWWGWKWGLSFLNK